MRGGWWVRGERKRRWEGGGAGGEWSKGEEAGMGRHSGGVKKGERGQGWSRGGGWRRGGVKCESERKHAVVGVWGG